MASSEKAIKISQKHLLGIQDLSIKDINLILNNANYDLLEKDKINVLWMHHFVNQKEAKNLGSKDFINKLEKFSASAL